MYATPAGRYTQSMATTLQSLQADLERVRESIRDTLELGAQYSVTGSHAATTVRLSELRKQETVIMRRIKRFLGYRSRTVTHYE
jgi:hypothetical protein